MNINPNINQTNYRLKPNSDPLIDTLKGFVRDIETDLMPSLENACTKAICPKMSIGSHLEFFCVQHKHMQRCPAFEYCDHLITKEIKPLIGRGCIAAEEPDRVLRRLVRIFMHASIHHPAIFDRFEEKTHCFERFIAFTKENFPATHEKRIVKYAKDLLKLEQQIAAAVKKGADEKAANPLDLSVKPDLAGTFIGSINGFLFRSIQFPISSSSSSAFSGATSNVSSSGSTSANAQPAPSAPSLPKPVDSSSSSSSPSSFSGATSSASSSGSTSANAAQQ